MLSQDDKTYKSIVPRSKGIVPKAAFYAWMETGSLRKASLNLEKEGMYNHRTGKAFTIFGVRHAACRFIATNHQEVRPVLIGAWNDAGVSISDDEWNRFVVETAAEYLSSSRDRFMNWLEANPFAQDYDYIYARQYGLEPKNRPPV